MTTEAPKSTLKTRARKVFGDIVTEDVESHSVAGNSLSYSPSPVTDRKSPQGNPKLRPPEPKAIKFQAGTKAGSNGPVSDTDKENDQNPLEADESIAESESKGTSYFLSRQREELQRLRKQAKSPLRRDLITRTQLAINNATNSVNHSLNAVRQAKAEKFQERAMETAKLRNQWRDEKEDAQQYHAQAEKSRYELLSLQRQLSSKFAKAKAQQDSNERNAQLAAIEGETNFKSEVYRTHKQSLKEEADRKRRHSTAARRKLRQNNREGEEKMRMMRIEEDQALLSERHMSSVAWRESKKAIADKRRNSFAFRNGDARRIRELHAKMEAERHEQEHLSVELKWAGEKDAEAYKKSLEEQRRDSFAFRNRQGCEQHEQESMRRAAEQNANHASYELKWAGERDAAAYKRHLEEERRKSFNFRNNDDHRKREETAIRLADEHAAEHASYELKWAGERDADEYQKKLAEERRQSFAGRNREGRNQRIDQEQRRAEEHLEEHQGFELKWAGEMDAEEYRRKMDQERRESFANRNKEGRRQREFQLEQKGIELAESHQSYELKWTGERDAEAYQQKLKEERRDSFAFRNKEGHRQRKEDSARASQEQQSEHESYELKWGSEKDAEAYKRKLEQERRDSFKFRNEEKARHQKVMEELLSIAREKETESFMLKWAGEEDAKACLVKLEEERRQSFQLRNEQGRRRREVDKEADQQRVQEAHVEEALQAACKLIMLNPASFSVFSLSH
jgi:hypothetical protein